MGDRPILFGGAMVRAILSGTKTQTRRLVKDSHIAKIGGSDQSDSDPSAFGYFAEGRDFSGWMVLERGVDERIGNNQDRRSIPCPLGHHGDRLWVRETCAVVPSSAYRCSREEDGTPVPHRVSPDGAEWAVYREGWTRSAPQRWRPSIHMPRWASRITLEVTEVRVERLTEISEADAKAEGVEPLGDMWRNYMSPREPSPTTVDAIGSFSSLWDSINGDDAWASNPWVWVVSFKRKEADRG